MLRHNTPNSDTLFSEALKLMPGGVNSPVRAFGGVGGNPVFFKSAEGAYMTSADNQHYVDYVGSWGSAIVGHRNPLVVEAVVDAAQKGLSFGAPTEGENQIASEIKKCIPSIEKIRLVNSGTEATMSAVRLARAYTQRPYIIKFEGCYHGHADSFLVKGGSGMLTFGSPNSPGVLAETTEKTIVLEYNNCEQLVAYFKQSGEQIAAVIVEPIAGNMNCIPATQDFINCIKKSCESSGVVLIFDEVMSGFRVALGGAQQLFGVEADLITLGKVIGGGLPVGAFGGKESIMNLLSPQGPVYQAGTLSGNPITVAAGLTTLKIIQTDDFYSKLNAKAIQLLNGMQKIADENNLSVHFNQVGGMFGLFFNTQEPVLRFDQVKKGVQVYNQFFHAMLEQHIYFAPSAYEAAFISDSHDDAVLEKTLLAFEKVAPILEKIK